MSLFYFLGVMSPYLFVTFFFKSEILRWFQDLVVHPTSYKKQCCYERRRTWCKKTGYILSESLSIFCWVFLCVYYFCSFNTIMHSTWVFAWSLGFCVVFCRSLLALLSFFFWLIVLSVLLRFTTSNYPFDIFRLFF